MKEIIPIQEEEKTKIYSNKVKDNDFILARTIGGINVGYVIKRNNLYFIMPITLINVGSNLGMPYVSLEKLIKDKKDLKFYVIE